MKFSIYNKSNNEALSDFRINGFAILKEMILKELFIRYKNEEEIILKIEELNKILFPNMTTHGFKVAKTLSDKVHSLFCQIERYIPSIFYNSAIIASEKESNIARILIIFKLKTEFINKNENPFNSFTILDKDTSSYVVKEFKKAFKLGILSDYEEVRLTEALGSVLNQIPVKKTDSALKKFILNYKDGSLVLVESDEYLNYLDLCRNNGLIKDAQIMLNPDFLSYLKDEKDSDSSSEELIEEFLNDTDIEFDEIIVEHLNKNKNKYKNHFLSKNYLEHVQFIKNDIKTDIFDILNGDISLSELDPIIFKEKY